MLEGGAGEVRRGEPGEPEVDGGVLAIVGAVLAAAAVTLGGAIANAMDNTSAIIANGG